MTQAEQLAAQAAQWQAAGRADMAAQLYGAALEHDPSKFAIRMQLAECLASLGQVEQAAEQYLMVAQAYAARGRQQECLAICERVLAIAPQAFVYMSVGPMVRRIGRQARPICARAAEAHLAAGRQTDGLQMLRLGAELDPHNPDVRRQLARIYQARHMRREAVEALLDAGNLLLQAKRYDDYVMVAEQILALEPRDLDTLRDLPRVYLELRRPHDAVRMLGVLTKASPGDIVGYEILAQAFALIGRIDKALSVLERLVEELGATGQADKADAILNHARYWRPTDVGFLRSLKRMEVPRPAPRAERPAAREAAPEGTVVLSIADLLVDDGGKAAPAPSKARGVQLTEADGTLTLRLDDLILDEMQQAAGRGVAPTKPPLGSPPPPPSRKGASAPKPGRKGAGKAAEIPVDSTISLDAADLIEALTGEIPRTAVEPPRNDAPTRPERREQTELLATDDETLAPSEEVDTPPTVAFQLGAPIDEETTTAPPASRSPAATRSMSELIYDDDDAEADTDTRDLRRGGEEEETSTLLHMKPLTAEDIARALAKQAAAAQAPAPAPVAPLRAGVDLDAPTLAPASARAGVDLDAPTIAPPSARGNVELDAHTAPIPVWTGTGMGDEAPTIAQLAPLTAADIARALSQRSPTRPPPSPVSEDAVTVPPPSGHAAGSIEPEEPPLLPPLLSTGTPVMPGPHFDDEDDEDESTMSMDALRPEDLLRGPGGRRSGPR